MPSSYQFALWIQESFLVPTAFFRNLLDNSKTPGEGFRLRLVGRAQQLEMAESCALVRLSKNVVIL